MGIARQCVRAARQLPRGQRRWRSWVGRPPCERARARACRLAAGVGRASRAERRPRNALARALTSSPLSARLARGRPVGAASAAVRLTDAPAWTRRWTAEAPVSLVAVRGAAQPAPTYWCGGSSDSPAAAPPELIGVPPLLAERAAHPRWAAVWAAIGRSVDRLVAPAPSPAPARWRRAQACLGGRYRARACTWLARVLPRVRDGPSSPSPSRGGRPELTTMRLGGGRLRLAPHPGFACRQLGTGVPQFPQWQPPLSDQI